jgi:hypothetical protein
MVSECVCERVRACVCVRSEKGGYLAKNWVKGGGGEDLGKRRWFS